MIFVIGKLIHALCASVPAPDVKLIVLLGVTVITPDLVMEPQEPVKVNVYVYVPDCVGVPLSVSVLFTLDHAAVIPDGNPLEVTVEVADVVYVVDTIGVFIQTV